MESFYQEIVLQPVLESLVEKPTPAEDLLPVLAEELELNGKALGVWLENNQNPVGINLYALSERLINLAAALKPRGLS